MPQIFSRKSNAVARASIAGVVILVVGGLWMAGVIYRSEWVTQVDIPRGQPVPFSHKHHVGGLGLDCRYCHTSVETSAFAGMPPTETCMTCHSQIWRHAPMLEPVRASFRTGIPLRWTQVQVLPDYVYFDHHIHVNKGIGCATCHGRIDQMPITWAHKAFQMQTCLDCHRHPEMALRPRSEIFDMSYRRPPAAIQAALGKRLMAEYHVDTRGLTDCYTCHR